MDTTRADRLGCYGYANAQTPALDAIAAHGALFEDAIAQVPLTLPSHCSILTGRFPKEFGVRNNNQAALGMTHPTLASIFKEHGYRTGAFVATFVLDSRFGLDRGFDVYEDEMAKGSLESDPLDWEQPANVIADRALAWLSADKSKPFFAWLHFYDPHDPYTPPAPYPKTYDAEIAFMDSQIKRVMDWLDKNAQRERTLVIVVGDHGESFGEHGEEGHGMFLYNTSLHVPLIFVHPALTSKPSRIANPVGAVDIFPTVLELFGWPKPQGLISGSLADAIRTGVAKPAEVFSESDYVWHSYGWAQQRSFTTPDWKFISSTRCELFDRKKDPQEKINLCQPGNPVGVQLSNTLADFYHKMIPTKAATIAPSAAATAALNALGYVSGSLLSKDEFLTAGAADPKDHLAVVARFKAARKLIKEEQYQEAANLLEAAGREAPDSLAIHAAHGAALVRAKRPAEALEILEKKALPLDAHHQPLLLSIGDAYFLLKEFDKALNAYTLAIENDPHDATAQYMMAQTYLSLQKKDDARAHFEKTLAIHPDFPEAHVELAKLLAELKQYPQAIARFQKALAIRPDFPDAHAELARLLADLKQYPQAINHFQESIKGKPNDERTRFSFAATLLAVNQDVAAVDQLREAVRLNPNYGVAWGNLGIALYRLGNPGEGKEALERATKFPESAVQAHLNLAIAALKENDQQAAKRHYEEILRLSPGHRGAAEALERLQPKP